MVVSVLRGVKHFRTCRYRKIINCWFFFLLLHTTKCFIPHIITHHQPVEMSEVYPIHSRHRKKEDLNGLLNSVQCKKFWHTLPTIIIFWARNSPKFVEIGITFYPAHITNTPNKTIYFVYLSLIVFFGPNKCDLYIILMEPCENV